MLLLADVFCVADIDIIDQTFVTFKACETCVRVHIASMLSYLPHTYVCILEDSSCGEDGSAAVKKSWLANTLTGESVVLGTEAR